MTGSPRRGILPYLGAACALALLIALRRTFDLDVFWHLATGKAALAQRTTLPVDVFSYSFAGAPWRYKDLLADVVLQAGFSRLGYAWLAALKAAAVLVIAAALWLSLPPSQRSAPCWLAGLGVHLLAVQYRFAERPLLFSLACFPLMLALCERARRLVPAAATAAALGRALLPLVLLQWLWAQLHREALVGLLLLSGLALYMLLARVASGRRWARPLLSVTPTWTAVCWCALAALVSAGLCLLNPSGPALFSTTIAVTKSPLFRQLVYEWKTLGLPQMAREFPDTLAVAAAGLLVIGGSLLASFRKRRPGPLDGWHLGCWLLFAAQARGSIRWLPQFAAVSALAVLLGLAAWAEPGAATGEAGPGRRPRGLGLLLLLCVPMIVAARSSYAPGLGELPDQYPAGALAFAAQHRLHERVANAFGLGGYVIWRGGPRFKVLVDGRNDMVYPAEFVVACSRAQKDAAAFAAMRAGDHADWVLAVNRPGLETHGFLADDPAWALVYVSEAALIYVRSDAYPELMPRRYQHVRPRTLPEGPLAATDVPIAALHEELLRLVRDDPDSARANVALALFYHDLGHRRGPPLAPLPGPSALQRRDQVLEHLSATRPAHPLLLQALRSMGLAAP